VQTLFVALGTLNEVLISWTHLSPPRAVSSREDLQLPLLLCKKLGRRR